MREGRTVLVEVGATWCKPCQTLKAAVAKGELDEVLGDVTILAFDADTQGERLDSLGYKSKYIPYFAVPNADGTNTGKQVDMKIPKEASSADIGAALAPLVRLAREK